MEPIIKPIDLSLLEQELNETTFLRKTNKADNEIYVVTAHNAPHVMREIGRLREIAFREAGGGTGKACDIDEFDLMQPACKQLLVWNPQEREIIGAYRYILGEDIRFDAQGAPRIATAHMFRFSPRFVSDILPETIELGRSFVRPEYQSSRAGAKAIFALDNLWDGLGALTVEHPGIKYLFGKMTMYPSYDRQCRDLLLCFLSMYFPDKDHLVTAVKPLLIDTDPDYLASILTEKDFKADYRLLNGEVRKLGFNIPPLVNAYMSLSPTMKVFGTAINYEFGNVEETGILIAVDEILAEKRVRHIDSYVREHPEAADLLGSVLNPPFKK